LIAAKLCGVAFPSKRTKAGKLKESVPEKVSMSSEA
jgi:hypothetical protein